MSPADAEELRKLDAAVDRIFKAVPEHPYILSVPCDEPRYHYPSQQEAQSWAKHTPFSLDEERLQYMTYLYREPSESCFVVRSQVDEERDRLAHIKKLNGAPSAPNTPLLSSVAKKKISLSAYKSKLAGQKAASPEKAASIKMERSEVRQLNGVAAEPQPTKSIESPQISAAPGQKRYVSPPPLLNFCSAHTSRSRDDPDASKPSFDNSLGSTPSAKKRRTSNPPLKVSHNSQLNGAPHELPSLLSPTFLPNTWNLPPMLSPTLPEKIEDALAREAKSRSRTDSNTSSSSSEKKVKGHVTSAATAVKAPLPTRKETPDLKTKSVVKPPTKPAPPISSMARSDLHKEIAAKSDSPARKASGDHEKKKIDVEESKTHPSMAPSKAAPGPEKQRLIVRLKYGKKRRVQVERILKLPPRPKPKPIPSMAVDRSDPERARASSGASQQGRPKTTSQGKEIDSPKQVAKKTVPPSHRSAKDLTTPEKRIRPDDIDNAPPAKRQKLPPNLDLEKNPRTPNQPSILSPSIQKSGGSIKSAAHLTPRDGQLKGANMVRSISNETPVSTPGKRAYLTPLPKAGERATTSAPMNGKAAESTALLNLSKQFNDLGRKLKHGNQAILGKPKDQITEVDRKKAALLGLECIMAYMLAYALGDARGRLDRRAAEIESTWLTLLPLFRFMGRSSQPFRHLEGLRYNLGVAICARIQAVLADRMARPTSSSAAAPSSSQETRDKSDSPHSLHQDPFSNTSVTSTKQTETASDNFKALTEFFREAGSKLPLEEIISSFPKTWEKRTTGARESGWEALVTKDGEASLGGKFFLPIGVDSTSIQAVRFGVRVLKEWVEKEGLEYEVQVKL